MHIPFTSWNWRKNLNNFFSSTSLVFKTWIIEQFVFVSGFFVGSVSLLHVFGCSVIWSVNRWYLSLHDIQFVEIIGSSISHLNWYAYELHLMVIIYNFRVIDVHHISLHSFINKIRIITRNYMDSPNPDPLVFHIIWLGQGKQFIPQIAISYTNANSMFALIDY